MPNTNYFELIFPCPATIIKPSSETQKQKTKVKAKYKRQKTKAKSKSKDTRSTSCKGEIENVLEQKKGSPCGEEASAVP